MLEDLPVYNSKYILLETAGCGMVCVLMRWQCVPAVELKVKPDHSWLGFPVSCEVTIKLNLIFWGKKLL